MPIDYDFFRFKKLGIELEENVLKHNSFVKQDSAHNIIGQGIQSFISRDTVTTSSVTKKSIEIKDNEKKQSILSEKLPHATDNSSLEARLSLAILIFASIMGTVPINLIQSTLESLFNKSQFQPSHSIQLHWSNSAFSPILWRIQERLQYLGILIVQLELDYNSRKDLLFLIPILYA